jgi:DNA repair protein RadC
MYIRDQIIQILSISRAEMRQALSMIDPAQESTSSWQPRELLAHIAGWDQLLTACLQAHASGETYTPTSLPDTDEFNRQSLKVRADFSSEQVTADWETRRQALVTVLQSMPPERFEVPLLFPWGQVGTIEDVLRGFAAHERRHAAELVKNAHSG